MSSAGAENGRLLSQPLQAFGIWDRSRSVGRSVVRSVGRSVKLLLTSPAQSFLASVSSRSMTKIFILSQTCTCTCFEIGVSYSTEGSVFLCRRYVCCTVVYPRCHGVQVTVDSAHALSLHSMHFHETSCSSRERRLIKEILIYHKTRSSARPPPPARDCEGKRKSRH
jgi:hypothetical protein